ncbi:hypothetical protein [Nocardia sp. NPDC052566]|uniref:hypothetical protein n=1 Tax=Nocardia sp. NPDC052566 TaxID=3364330 RepID=UPI0037CBE71B
MGGDGAVRARIPRWFVLWMRLIALVVLVVGLVLLWQVGAEGSFPTVVLLWVGLAVVVLVAVLFGLFGILRYRAYVSALVVPLLVGILAALVWFDIPRTVGWQLSRGILEDQAVACDNPGRHTRLGVYTITFIDRRDGGCLFYTQAGEDDSVGFGYFPDAPPPRLGPAPSQGIGYEPFHGRWYRFTDKS